MLWAGASRRFRELARMPFEEKIKILVNLQKIAQNIPGFSKNKQIVWDLE